MGQNYSLHFYLKKPKNYEKGPIPIYMRITGNDSVRKRLLLPETLNLPFGIPVPTVQKVLTRPQRPSTAILGELWIFTSREKNDNSSNIPLLDIPKQIMDKYKNRLECTHHGLALPILSNQKMNAYLKEIADICKISKLLTFHIARHTFATTVTLSNNVPIETVSKMLGHKDIRTTQHYAKVSDDKISRDMKELNKKLRKRCKSYN